MIYDFYSDPSQAVLEELIGQHGPQIVPDYVKSASVLQPSEEFRSEKRAWAWPQAERFALDTPSDVWLSKVYFTKTASVIPVQFRQQIADNIARAAEIFNLDVSLPSEKRAAAPVEFADPVLAIYGLQKTASGFSMVHETHEQTHIANQSFPQGLDDREFDLHKVAQSLLNFTLVEGIPPSAQVREWATPIKRSSIVDQMQARFAHCQDSNRRAARIGQVTEKEASYQSELTRFGSLPSYEPGIEEAYQILVQKAASVDGEDIAKILEACDGLDRMSGLDKVAGIRPAHTLNRTLIEDLAPRTVKLAGRLVPLGLIESFRSDVQGLVPEMADVWGQSTKMAHLLEESPLHRQQAIVFLIQNGAH